MPKRFLTDTRSQLTTSAVYKSQIQVVEHVICILISCNCQQFDVSFFLSTILLCARMFNLNVVDHFDCNDQKERANTNWEMKRKLLKFV